MTRSKVDWQRSISDEERAARKKFLVNHQNARTIAREFSLSNLEISQLRVENILYILILTSTPQIKKMLIEEALETGESCSDIFERLKTEWADESDHSWSRVKD